MPFHFVEYRWQRVQRRPDSALGYTQRRRGAHRRDGAAAIRSFPAIWLQPVRQDLARHQLMPRGVRMRAIYRTSGRGGLDL